MRRLLLALLFCLLAVPAAAQVAFVQGGHNKTPAGTHSSPLDTTIPATNDGNTLVVAVGNGDEPAAVQTVTAVEATGASFFLQGALTNGNARAELWTARNVAAGITSVRVTWTAPTVGVVNIGEYSGVQGLGAIATASGSSTNPTISLATYNNNNIVACVFSEEGLGTGQITAATTGTFRSSDYALGDGAPDVASALIDNTSATPASVTCTATNASTNNWAAVALDLRSVFVPAASVTGTTTLGGAVGLQ